MNTKVIWVPPPDPPVPQRKNPVATISSGGPGADLLKRPLPRLETPEVLENPTPPRVMRFELISYGGTWQPYKTAGGSPFRELEVEPAAPPSRLWNFLPASPPSGLPTEQWLRPAPRRGVDEIEELRVPRRFMRAEIGSGIGGAYPFTRPVQRPQFLDEEIAVHPGRKWMYPLPGASITTCPAIVFFWSSSINATFDWSSSIDADFAWSSSINAVFYWGC